MRISSQFQESDAIRWIRPTIRAVPAVSAITESIKVNVEKDPGGHDRWIRSDAGWRINLGRGLDIFQKSDGNWLDFGTARQEFRQVKGFGVTYIRDMQN